MAVDDPTPTDWRKRLAGYRWHWKDYLIAALGVVVVVLLFKTFEVDLSAAGGGAREGLEPVEVFDVVLDRENRAWVDFLFDRPVQPATEGGANKFAIFGSPPATVDPALPGVWRWQGRNVLRFEPSGGFPPASAFSIALIPDRLLSPDQRLSGETTFEVRTDRFLVESVEIVEELDPEDSRRVILRGTLRFNYDVDPELLAPKTRLVDEGVAEGETSEVYIERHYTSRVIPFRTDSIEKKSGERTVRLIIAGDLTPTVGNSPLGEDHVEEIPIGSRERLTVREVTTLAGLTESTVRITFSSPVGADLARPYIHVEPETAYRLAAERNVVRLVGDFTPGSSYELTVEAGLPARDDAVLAEEYKGSLRLANLPATVDFENQGMFLARSGNHALVVETVNTERLRLTVDRVYRNNLFFLLQYGGQFGDSHGYLGSGVWHPLGERIADETLAIASQPNRKIETTLALDRFIDPEEPGFYRVLIGKPGDWQGPQRWVLVTDLGVVAKSGKDEFLIWALSNRSLDPVEGAKVTLLSDQNQILARGRTDANGFWRFRNAEGLEDQRPFLVTIEQGGDFTFLHLDRMRIDSTGLEVAGAAQPASGYTAFVYGERDLYRPGETLHGLVLVRDPELSPAPAMPALLRYRDPEGRELETRHLDLEGGLAEFEWDLPAYTLTGHQTLELIVADEVIGSYRFQVEEFVPDRIKVRIETSGDVVGPGDDLAFLVASEYLFGPPAAGLAVESRVRLVDSTFSAAGYQDFSFRNTERSFDDRELLVETATLDDKGQYRFSIGLPVHREVPSTLQAVITARIQEQGGRGVTAVSQLAIRPYSRYVGLRRVGEGYPEPGEDIEFEFVTVDAQGRETAAEGLEARLLYDRWHTVLRRTPSGNYKYESNRESVLVEHRTLTGGRSRGKFSLRARDYGGHRVVLTDPVTGASASVAFYASGWGYAPWAVENPDRVELELDREEYAPGDTAVVQIRTPFPGKLLLTVERDGILDTQVHTLDGNTATIRLPIRSIYRPNAYVTATVVRGVGDIEAGSVGRAFGAVPLPVDRLSNRLAVELEAPDHVRSSTTLEVGVRSRPGSSLTVAAVDEGILQLIAQQTADPFDFFYRKLRLGVISYDTFSLLFPEAAGEEPAGGGRDGSGRAQFVRTEGIRRVEPVAFWSGLLQTDEEGRATATFELPDFQGSLRIMAVSSSGKRFGSSQTFVRVRDPLVLTPTLPRIVSFQETLQIPVTLRNDTGRGGDFELSLALEGPATVVEERVFLTIPHGSERTAYFTVHTSAEAGSLRFRFTAAGNDDHAKASVGVDVRADLPAIAVEASGSLSQLSTELAGPDVEMLRPETVQRRLHVGSLPVVQFGGKLSSLLRYPYGCLEQTLSRAFPLLYLGDLARQFEPELFDPEAGRPDSATLVDHALRKVSFHQVHGGGFSLWRGRRAAQPWVSVYAAHFLVEADRSGHAVDANLLAKSLDYLQGLVRAKSRYGSDELERTAYALYVLARAGRADLGTMDFVRDKQQTNLRPESQGLLAAAYASVGHREAVEELVTHLGEVERIERQTGDNLSSTVRNRAMLLLALLSAVPDSPRIPALVERLARDVSEVGYWTTQDSAFTLVALGQFVRQQASRPPYSGTVYLGDRVLGSVSSAETATFHDLPAAGRLRIEMDPGYEAGSAFFSLIARGVPTDASFEPVGAGLEIRRELLSRTGAPVDRGAIRQGDLLVLKTRIRSTSGPAENVVIEQLLASGLEVENPRLETTESLPWVADANLKATHLDLRDDRILIFADLPHNSWQNVYSLVRAVSPGIFRLPPVHAEAMYNPALRATGQRGLIQVERLEP